MAIYHIKLLKGGGYSVQAEMRLGGQTHKSLPWRADDLAGLRTQMQNVALIVGEQRKGVGKIRGAQVKRGGE